MTHRRAGLRQLRCAGAARRTTVIHQAAALLRRDAPATGDGGAVEVDCRKRHSGGTLLLDGAGQPRPERLIEVRWDYWPG